MLIGTNFTSARTVNMKSHRPKTSTRPFCVPSKNDDDFFEARSTGP